MYLKSLKVRLTTVFSIVFIIAAAAFYVVSYILISSSLQQEERRLLRAKLLEFWAVYQTGMTQAVQQQLTLENFVSESTAFLVRVADRDNATIVLFRPTSWRIYDLDVLAEIDPTHDGGFATVAAADEGSVLTIATVRLFDGNILQIGVGNAQRIELLANLRRVYLLVAAPLVLLAVAGGWIVSSRTLAPVKKLSTLSRHIIDTGELSRRIPATGSRDELDELVRLFNGMLEKIETLVTGMRLSLDNVAHDLRTPMTRLRMRAEDSIRHADDSERVREMLGSIVLETEQMLTMLTTLMDISEAEAGVMRLDRKTIDMSDLVRDIAELYSYTASDADIALHVDSDGSTFASVDVNRMRQVVANLLDNAVKYTDPGGRVTIAVRGDGAEVRISVRDSGVGIDESDLSRIWDRLYRADRSRTKPGLGLGLGLVKAVVEAHGGSVSAESTPGAGSTFSVVLPASDTTSPA